VPCADFQLAGSLGLPLTKLNYTVFLFTGGDKLNGFLGLAMPRELFYIQYFVVFFLFGNAIFYQKLSNLLKVLGAKFCSLINYFNLCNESFLVDTC